MQNKLKSVADFTKKYLFGRDAGIPAIDRLRIFQTAKTYSNLYL